MDTFRQGRLTAVLVLLLSATLAPASNGQLENLPSIPEIQNLPLPGGRARGPNAIRRSRFPVQMASSGNLLVSMAVKEAFIRNNASVQLSFYRRNMSVGTFRTLRVTGRILGDLGREEESEYILGGLQNGSVQIAQTTNRRRTSFDLTLAVVDAMACIKSLARCTPQVVYTSQASNEKYNIEAFGGPLAVVAKQTRMGPRVLQILLRNPNNGRYQPSAQEPILFSSAGALDPIWTGTTDRLLVQSNSVDDRLVLYKFTNQSAVEFVSVLEEEDFFCYFTRNFFPHQSAIQGDSVYRSGCRNTVYAYFPSKRLPGKFIRQAVSVPALFKGQATSCSGPDLVASENFVLQYHIEGRFGIKAALYRRRRSGRLFNSPVGVIGQSSISAHFMGRDTLITSTDSRLRVYSLKTML